MMKRWAGNVILAGALGGISGDGKPRVQEFSPAREADIPAAHVASMPHYELPTLSSKRNAYAPSDEEVSASNRVWKALVKSARWDYSRMFDSGMLQTRLEIDTVKLQGILLDDGLTMSDIAKGYKAMTGEELLNILVDERLPALEDIHEISMQLQHAFRQVKHLQPVAAKAEALRTLKDNTKKPRFMMAAPRYPISENYKSGIERLEHWGTLKQVVESLGGEVVLHDISRPVAGNCDALKRLEVFTRDPVIVLHDKKIALIPDFDAMEKDFRPLERDPHVPDMVAALKREDYKVKPYKGRVQGGDVIYDAQRKLILVGLDRAGFEVNRSFTQQDSAAMEELTGCKVLRIKRMSAHFYHLDTAIAPLPDGKYLINPQCMDKETYGQVCELIGVGNIIEIPQNEERYMANLMAVGKALIMPACSDELNKKLKTAGFIVVTPEKVGLKPGAWDIDFGGPHCMIQQVMNGIMRHNPDLFAALSESGACFALHEDLRRQQRQSSDIRQFA